MQTRTNIKWRGRPRRTESCVPERTASFLRCACVVGMKARRSADGSRNRPGSNVLYQDRRKALLPQCNEPADWASSSRTRTMMSSANFWDQSSLVHKDFVYLSLYRVTLWPGSVKRGVGRWRECALSFGRAASWLSIVNVAGGITAIFEKRPQFCPILIMSRRMNSLRGSHSSFEVSFGGQVWTSSKRARCRSQNT
jgi:hypothetical protein